MQKRYLHAATEMGRRLLPRASGVLGFPATETSDSSDASVGTKVVPRAKFHLHGGCRTNPQDGLAKVEDGAPWSAMKAKSPSFNSRHPSAASNSGDFYVVVGAMLVILVGMLAFFRRRGWL